MKKYSVCISSEEYAEFSRNPATRSYLHSFSPKTGTLTVETSKPWLLANELEKIIDFGATSARDVLNLPAKVY